MAELWLLCEGDSDVRVLASVFTKVLAAEIIPKPAGGSSNAASAAEYVVRHYGDKGVVIAYVIDRDYRRRDVADATFTDKKRCFIWRRHAIESYLLEPAVIVEAFRRLKAPGGGPVWLKSLPEDVTVVAEGLRACARACSSREAGCLALERLWEDLSETAGRIQKRLPAPLSGGISLDAASCRQALLDEAARLITRAHETASSPHLEPSSIGQRYDKELARISALDYLIHLRFLEEFHGKHLLAVLLEWLQKEYKCPLPAKRLIKSLEEALPAAYSADRSLYGTDDFLDLANGVRALAGLPPLG
jgi:hypothetical protein